MSFLLGPVSGALVAGGVYYGFSTMIQTRTEQHRTDLHLLSARLAEASIVTSAPLPAAARIEYRPFLALMKSSWNDQVGALFKSVGELNHRAVEWGRQTLYGGGVSSGSKRDA